jgi:hypothetical protein
MSMVWLLRLVLLFLIFSTIYFTFKYLFTPKRKIESARKHKRFLLLDNKEVVKNFQLTHNGVVFTGEKYLGAAKNTNDVVSISLSPENPLPLKGMSKEEFYFIEKKILEKYPAAKVTWKSHIQEFLQEK